MYDCCYGTIRVLFVSSCSPALSDTSSQGAPVDPEMFTGANIGQKENNLMSTLSHYYKEQSVSHVTGWQGELVEKQVCSCSVFNFTAQAVGSRWSYEFIVSESQIPYTYRI